MKRLFLLFGMIFALTAGADLAWSASEKAAAKHPVARKHKVAKKTKAVTAPVPATPVPQLTPAPPSEAMPAQSATPEATQVTTVGATPEMLPTAAKPAPMGTGAVTPVAIATEKPAAPKVAPPPVNPYMLVSPVIAKIIVAPPITPVAVLVPPLPSLPGNPYLQHIPFHPAVANQPPANFFPAFAISPSGNLTPTVLAFVPNEIGKQSLAAPAFNDIATLAKSLVPTQLATFLPGDEGASHWPISVSIVHPTGDKPLAVLTLKCPTEAAFGFATPPVKLVHIILTTAMDGVNYSGLLPFNMQQVCQ